MANDAATGFSRGFYGFFGMLAAIGLVGLVLFVVFVLDVHHQGALERDARAMADPPASAQVFDALAACQTAAALAPKALHTAGSIHLAPGPETLPPPWRGSIGRAHCPAADREGALVLDVNVSCADMADADCVHLLGAMRAGRALSLR